MDPDYGIDIAEMARVIDEAEVLVIRFQVVSQRLLLDTRTGDDQPPLVELVAPVSSAEERYRYLARARPGLPLPDDITVLAWPRYIEVMRDSGVWQRIVERMTEAGGPEMARVCERVYDEVRRAERAELSAAIVGGEGYESLWERR